jgi:predicted nucleic acid-binding protein
LLRVERFPLQSAGCGASLRQCKSRADQSIDIEVVLRRQGITVRKTIDVVIATFCVQDGIVLRHADRDFDPMQGISRLSVVSN